MRLVIKITIGTDQLLNVFSENKKNDLLHLFFAKKNGVKSDVT